MLPELTTPAAVLIINTIILITLALYTYKRRSIEGGLYLVLLLISVAFWSLTAFFEEMAVGLPAKIMWSKISYLGIVTTAPFFFLFLITYCGLNKTIKPAYKVLFWLPPVVVFASVLTNELHGLVWTSVVMDTEKAGKRAIYNHGPMVHTIAIYSYLLLVAGLIWVIRTARTSHHLFQKQLITLIAASLAPWAGNVLYLAGLI